MQQQQVDTMITKGVDVIILDAVDAKAIAGSVKKADEAGIPVVAYDRLAEGPISALHLLRQREGRQGSRARRCWRPWATRPRTARSS